MPGRTSLALAASLLASACEGEPSAPEPPKAKAPAAQAATAPAPEPKQVVEERPTSAAAAEGQGAAQVLQTYYALIEAGKYAEAYALREPRAGVTPERFADNFERYAEHSATIGAPSEPVQAGGWLYVEVPVHTYGAMKGGKPFGSGGTVTLRRRATGGEWRLYTKG